MSYKHRLQGLLLACPGFQPLCRMLTRHHVRALMYHRFHAEAGEDERSMNATRLREQVNWLRRHHDLWQPDNHLDYLRGQRRLGRCPVVVTVDDGYADFYSVAFPIFREYSIPVMLFVATGFVDGTTWFWWDRLAWMLAHAPVGRGTADIGGREVDWDLSSDEGRTAAWHGIADRCRFISDTQKEALLRTLGEALGVTLPDQVPPEYASVTWEQVRTMAAAGLLVGAHSVTHPILSRVLPDGLAAEILGSRRRLQEAAEIDTAWFCYPQGGPADFTPAVQESVREAGFRGCYVAWQIDRRPPDPYALPRYCISTDRVEFRWTLCGAEWLVLCARRRLGMGTDPGDWYWGGAR